MLLASRVFGLLCSPCLKIVLPLAHLLLIKRPEQIKKALTMTESIKMANKIKPKMIKSPLMEQMTQVSSKLLKQCKVNLIL